ncbi:hypothetical protein EGR_10498 [Echinococcus granulosus]|uniref:Uncharacterized protein n=1 Tax=Echinococcus granulosus TaxID=6210 RepID=W6U279_ECHGR|nr:hypothetical protein EGR_10498 [Echinococcus granulosus]EUB54646.1 hypothetical protein EGR_10498 [Echinococcus granulosus]
MQVLRLNEKIAYTIPQNKVWEEFCITIGVEGGLGVLVNALAAGLLAGESTTQLADAVTQAKSALSVVNGVASVARYTPFEEIELQVLLQQVSQEKQSICTTTEEISTTTITEEPNTSINVEEPPKPSNSRRQKETLPLLNDKSRIYRAKPNRHPESKALLQIKSNIPSHLLEHIKHHLRRLHAFL